MGQGAVVDDRWHRFPKSQNPDLAHPCIREWMQTHNANVFDNSYFAPSFSIRRWRWNPLIL